MSIVGYLNDSVTLFLGMIQLAQCLLMSKTTFEFSGERFSGCRNALFAGTPIFDFGIARH